MRINKVTLLLLLIAYQWQAAHAQATDGIPETGKTYYIYNVYKKCYMAFDAYGNLSLGAQGSPLTLSSTTRNDSYSNNNTENTFFLSTDSGTKISTSFLGDITADGKGTYDHWVFEPVKGTSNNSHIYTIGVRIPDAGTVAFLYWSELFDKVLKLYLLPATSYEKGQWLLVPQEDYENAKVITLDETSENYLQPAIPTSGSTTVHLKRSFTIDSWNSLCLPFTVTSAQLQSVMGAGTKVAEFTGCTDNTLEFTSASNIEAGKPYLVCPKQISDNGYYEFTDVKSFEKVSKTITMNASNTTNASGTSVAFQGYFYKTVAPKGAYVLHKNEVYHLQSDMPMKGFRAYFIEEKYATAKINQWSLDGVATNIDEIANESLAQKVDVFNLNGQRVASQVTTLKDLIPGIYLVHGKKIVIR